MKRRSPVPRTQPAPAAAPVQAPAAPAELSATRRGLKAALFTLLLLLAMTVQTGPMALVLCVLAFLSLLGKAPMARLRGRVCLPVLGLLAFALVYGAATLYSPFGSDAVSEYYKFLAASSLAVIVLTRYDRADVPGLLWGGAGISAFIGVVSVDLACEGAVFRAFHSVVSLLGASFDSVSQSQWGTQVAGIYNDANVTAALFALGTILSLYLLDRAGELRAKLPAALLLGINALAFFLSMSRGGILCFAVSMLVYLVLAGKGRCLPLFFLMAVSAASTVALSLPAMSHIISGSVLPTLLLFANGLVIFALDHLLVRRLSALAAAHIRAGAIATGVVLALCVGYGVAAFTVTGPYTFDSTGVVVRGVDLAPDTYTLTTLPESVRVTILGQTPYEKLTDQYQTVYDSNTGELTFTVPEGLSTTRFQLYAEAGTVVEELSFTDGSRYQLGYPLLPAFAANRLLTGMGSSFSTRLIFDQDAWKLFLQSPVLGHGLGSTENLYRSVQTFQYESVYVHNHLLQTLSDTGLLGTLGALAFVLGSAWLCLRALRREGDPLAAMLLTAWVMMNLHSLMEINFSVRGFKCFAYVLLTLPVLLWGQSLLTEETARARKTAKRATVAIAAVLGLYLAVFGALLESRRMVAREEFATSDVYEYLDYLKSAIRRNAFDHDQDALSYVGNAVLLNDPRYNGAMLDYVAELRASGTYENCSGLARYYYLPRGEWAELFACSREGIRQVRSSPDGWDLQLDFYRTAVLPAMEPEELEVFVSGVTALREALNAMNGEGRLEEISFNEANQTFLNLLDSGRAEGLPDDALYALLLSWAPAE